MVLERDLWSRRAWISSVRDAASTGTPASTGNPPHRLPRVRFDAAQAARDREPSPPRPPKKRRTRRASARAAAAFRARRDYDRRYDLAALDKLRAMGVNLIPVELPNLPYSAMVSLLTAEAAAAFDELTLSGRDKLLTEQGPEDWPNVFRIARFYPAVEYSRPIAPAPSPFGRCPALRTGRHHRRHPPTACNSSPPTSPDIPHIVPNGLRGDDAPRPPKSTTATTTISADPAPLSASPFSPTTIRTPSYAPLPAPISRRRIFTKCIPASPAFARDS